MSNDVEFKASLNEIAAFKELKSIIVKEFGLEAVADEKISRFLRARDFDVKQGYIMLKKHLEWRRNYKIDTILQDVELPEVFKKYITINHIGFDRQDSPALLSVFGKLDCKSIPKCGTRGEILRHIAYFLEWLEVILRERSKAIGKDVTNYTLIGNLDDFSFSNVASKSVLELTIDVCHLFEANYPERLKMIIDVNAPTSFQLFCSFLKRFLSPKTMGKINVYGKDGWQEELFKYVDPSILPAYMGGTRTDPDGNPMCYSFVCHGGPIPEEYFMKNAGKQYLRNQEGVQSHFLQRRSKFNLPFEIEDEGSIIKWEFETDNYDVGFGLFYKDFNTTEDDDELLPLIPVKRFDSCMLRAGGTYTCEKPGIYTLTLDNSYSFFRSKKIYYRTTIFKPGDSDLLKKN